MERFLLPSLLSTGETIMQLTKRDIARFEKNFWKGEGCWLWQGARSHGYGHFRLGQTIYQAHRIAYLIEFGPFDEHLYVCHSCDNRLCVNTIHLFLGTHQDNMDDMVKKGRQEKGQRHHNSTLLDSEVVEIIRLHQSGNYTQTELAKLYQVSEATVSRMLSGQRKVRI